MEKYTDIKTFEDACKVENLDPKKVLPDFSCYPEQDRKSMVAHAKLVIIVKAANRLANDGQHWTPDFTDSSERKYEPLFYMGSSGFRFIVNDLWLTLSFVGSRLCFFSREVCRHITNQFIDVYNDYLI